MKPRRGEGKRDCSSEGNGNKQGGVHRGGAGSKRGLGYLRRRDLRN